MAMAPHTRDALLDAAEAVFTEHGLARATIDQITARAGVAKGTFYLYFRSKDEVVAALQERLWDQLMAAAVDTAAKLDGDDWWGVVDSFLETVVDFDIEHREWHRQIAQGWAQPSSHGREEQMIALFAGRISDGVERGVLDVDIQDVDMAAQMLFWGCQGTAYQVCLSEGEVDRDRLVRAHQWFVRRVLAKRAAAQ